MKIVEIRVPFPLSMDEYCKGYRYCEIEAMKAETGGGAGVEIVFDEEFRDRPSSLNAELTCGFHRRFLHITHPKLPWLVRKYYSNEQTELVEELWNYGECLEARIKSDYLGDSVSFECLTWCKTGNNAALENVFNLDSNELKQRTVHDIDLCQASFSNDDEQLDPLTAMAQIGRDHWRNSSDHYQGPSIVMYRRFVGAIGEAILARVLLRVQAKFLRRIIVDYRNYCSMTEDQLRQFELYNGGTVLRQLRNGDQLKGTICDSNNDDECSTN